jgi:GTP-binding protein
MTFRDRVKIFARAGAGGAGSMHFRREKYVPLGGPDGGDGGRGGSIYVVADPGLNTLWRYIHQRHFRAESGGPGSLRRRHGSAGDDLLLPVPVGTVVHDETTGEVLADLARPGQRVMVARGGRGGLGNTHFATATFQAPRIAEKGEPGAERTLLLELKLIADVGIVGLPNAGKSTLLAALTQARPKIADFPFTTLEPHLGVIEVDDYSFVLADIPGLIEGAHTGLGLGHDFLRHVERTSVLIHMVDGAAGTVPEVLGHIATIQSELALYSADLAQRPRILVINKLDLPAAQANLPGLRAALESRGLPIYAISAATVATPGALVPLTREVSAILRRERARVATFAADAEVPSLPPPLEELRVEPVGPGAFEVFNRRAERAVAMTDMASEDGLERLQALLARFGVTRALAKAGVHDGDSVTIGPATLVWGDQEVAPASRRLTRRERMARRSQQQDDSP